MWKKKRKIKEKKKIKKEKQKGSMDISPFHLPEEVVFPNIFIKRL
jgi:hypothetical protein